MDFLISIPDLELCYLYGHVPSVGREQDQNYSSVRRELSHYSESHSTVLIGVLRPLAGCCFSFRPMRFYRPRPGSGVWSLESGAS